MRSSANGTTVEGPLDEEAIRDVWSQAQPYLAKALERDGYKLEPADLLEQIATGLMGMYVITDDDTGEMVGAVACEVQEYPQSQVFNIAYCGGRELHRWAPLLGALEAEAARFGCDTVRITGRPGWGRVYPDYQEACRIYERKVLVEQ